MMAGNPRDRPTMKHVRTVLEQLYVSLTTEEAIEDESQDMYLLKRQRRRSTHCLETWAQEIAMEDFSEEDDVDANDDEVQVKDDSSCNSSSPVRGGRETSQTSYNSQSSVASTCTEN